MFGVRPTTIARWAREGKLHPVFTPGGHRRYSAADIHKIIDAATTTSETADITADAVKMYEHGWSVRQVALRFEWGYGPMRRLLKTHTTLRTRGGTPTERFPV